MTSRAGCGIADITGEIAECGMLGYGLKKQQGAGLHLRLRARAFAVEDADGARVLLVVCDLPLMFGTLVEDVLERLPEGYTESNVMITATHTHCAPGGYALHTLYNSTAGGFRPRTHGAIVDGIVEAATAAHESLAPATLSLGFGELHEASRNRSQHAFDRNPDRAFFPKSIDPQVTVLRIEQEGRTTGLITWFATHQTSMTNTNRLVTGDNKGYASYHVERGEGGAEKGGAEKGCAEKGCVAAFPQTNAGDMSPNLELKPGMGPTGDEFANTRIIGTRQVEAAAAAGGAEIDGPVDGRLTHFDWSDTLVQPEFTGDGRAHRTSGPVLGATALAGAMADGPTGWPFRADRNPVWDALSKYLIYPLAPKLRDSQAPKTLTVPFTLLNRLLPWTASRGPVQLLRIGPLYLIGVPSEVTIVAGLRLRRAVAGVVGTDVRNVLVAGYSNGYLQYTTTPEEYDAGAFEGSCTPFGRWQLPMLCQAATELATAMRGGDPVPRGVPEPRPAVRASKHKLTADGDLAFGRVTSLTKSGSTATATFVGAHPGHDLRRGRTFLEVERREGEQWARVADDGDWSTKFHWSPGVVRIVWEAEKPGTYRIRYLGDTAGGPVTGLTEPFEI